MNIPNFVISMIISYNDVFKIIAPKDQDEEWTWIQETGEHFQDFSKDFFIAMNLNAQKVQR